ncbi:MAG: VWA domain-containing protein [Pseudomonadota bacterium]
MTVPSAAAPLISFASVLRQHGFPVAPDQTIGFLDGVRQLGPRELTDIYRAARALFAIPRDREPEFAALFRAHFLGQTISAPTEGENDEDVEARESTGVQDAAQIDEREEEPGQEATGAERLGTRTLASGEILRDFRRSAARALPRRLARRRKRHPSGNRLDLRRTMREAARRDGEVLTLPRTRRRTQQRRIVLMIDVSGSMAEGTEPILRFAHTLLQSAERAEVFTLGTRLTRITRDLRHRDPEVALGAVSQVVADFDGGTRLGGALEAFLAVPRFAATTRGAAVTVLSDGLERGDPMQMIDAVRRLSRMAWRLDWLTPLAADAGFVPRTQALAAILPDLDALGDGSSPERVAQHLLTLAEAR